MKFSLWTKLLLTASLTVVLGVGAGVAHGHVHRHVAETDWTVGFIVEPAFEGVKNGVHLRVTKEATKEEMAHEDKEGMEHGGMATGMDIEAHGTIFGSEVLAPGDSFSFEIGHDLEGLTIPFHSHLNHELTGTITVAHTGQSGMVQIEIHDDEFHPADITVQPGAMVMWKNEGSSPQAATSGVMTEADEEEGHGHAEDVKMVPVEGLEESLEVEVTHMPSGMSRVMKLRRISQEPGYYTADFIPTAAGTYQFRYFGTLEGAAVDETFISQGGGDFSDVQSSVDIQVPEEWPEVRELDSAVRGAAAAAADADDSASSATTLAVVGLALAIVGIVAGLGGVGVALRRR